MEQKSLKLCNICFQEIDDRARKCPYCHHWQNKITMALFHPVVVAMAPILVMLFFYFIFINKITGGEKFDLHRDKVTITQPKLEFGESECGSDIVIIGKINNKSNFTWENPQFEITFVDEKNNLFDTGQDELYSFIIPANNEIPFKVSIKKQFPEESYNTYEVKILSAKEKDTFF